MRKPEDERYHRTGDEKLCKIKFSIFESWSSIFDSMLSIFNYFNFSRIFFDLIIDHSSTTTTPTTPTTPTTTTTITTTTTTTTTTPTTYSTNRNDGFLTRQGT